MLLTPCQLERLRSAQANRIKYAYDALSRLVHVQRDAEPPTELRYDPAGYRRERTSAEGLSLFLGEWLELRSGDGVRARLLHATGLDGVLAEVSEPLAGGTRTTRTLLPDGAGNVVAVATGAGSLGLAVGTRPANSSTLLSRSRALVSRDSYTTWAR